MVRKADIRGMIHSTAQSALRTLLPADFYRDRQLYDQCLDTLFAPSWQFLAGPEIPSTPGHAHPVTLLPGSLNELLLLSVDADGKEHVLSNVCTHRGNLLVSTSGRCRQLVCGYHGRAFAPDGTCLRQPGLDRVNGFPGREDDLRRPASGHWAGLRFVRLAGDASFGEWMAPVAERTAHLPWETLEPLPEHFTTYPVRAHWALYTDNFLEGLHIPFIHPALREALDLSVYPIHLFPWGSLQMGLAKENEPAFDLPPGHPDAGSRVYAWYFWLFPNLMLNVYPWGLSVNVVEPTGPDTTRVRYLTYRFSGQQGGPQTHALAATEEEDDRVVEQVQRGTGSRLYHPGHLVPEWESAVVHFHQLVLRHLPPRA